MLFFERRLFEEKFLKAAVKKRLKALMKLGSALILEQFVVWQ